MEYKIIESEYRFLTILWENEPVESPKLVKLCEEALGWKKSTTYTVIKNLSLKGIIENVNTIVRSVVPREEIVKQESEHFLERTFNGDVMGVFAHFLKDRKLSREEAERIRKMIEEEK